MPFCGKCGTKIDEGVKFCPSCGEPVAAPATQPGYQQAAQPGYQQPEQPAYAERVEQAWNKFTDTPDSTGKFDPADVEKNKIMGVLAYCSWLVLIPIFAAQESRFARFHVNQGLVLAIAQLIVFVIYQILWNILPYGFLWRLVRTVNSIIGIAFLLIAIVGIVNALGGKAKQLPIIGNIKFFK